MSYKNETIYFPTIRYKSGSPQRFNSLEELEAAGPGWDESPDGKQDVIAVPESDETVKAEVIEKAVAEPKPVKNILLGSGSFGETAPAEPPPGVTEVPAEGVDVGIEVLREEAKSLGIRGNINVFKRETLIKKIAAAKATE